MLNQVHFLLTYSCNYECEHCFLYCSPRAGGTFTSNQIKNVLDEAKKLGSVEWIYFEGGEPFLYYPLMIEGLRSAKEMGFRTGVVTNCYWATSAADAELWLKPIWENGLEGLCLSDDSFHHGETGESPAKVASKAAESLGMSGTLICIDEPSVKAPAGDKGAPVVEGGALFKGRAADRLVNGLPKKTPETFIECLHEELVSPKRVHVDSFGNVMVCQGISIGNMWKKPLSELVGDYNAETHPICGPISRGGPAELANVCGVRFEGEFVDECHYCFEIRRNLLKRYPEFLSPEQVYGLDGSE